MNLPNRLVQPLDSPYSPYDMRLRVHEAKRKSFSQIEIPGRYLIPLTFVLFLLLLSLLSWFALSNMRYLELSFRNSVEIQGGKLKLLNDMVSVFQQQQLNVRDAITSGNPFDETHLTLSARFDHIRSQFLHLNLTDEERKAIDKINFLLTQVHTYQMEAINHALMGHQAEAFRILSGQMNTYLQQLLQDLVDLRERQFQVSETDYWNARQKMHENEQWLLILGLTSFLLGGITAYSVVYRVFKSFKTSAAQLFKTHQTLESTNEQLRVENKARRRAEHEIRRHRDELEMKVQQRTTELRQEVIMRRQIETELLQAKNFAEEATDELSAKNKALLHSMQQLQTTQEHLVQVEKMASLGGLVAGIAHEINTPLGMGITSTSYLHDKIQQFQHLLDSGNVTKRSMDQFMETLHEANGIALTNLQRAAEQVNSFKQMAVDQTSEMKRVFNVHDYVQEILLSLKPKLKKTPHRIQLNCPPDIEAYSFPGAYSQVITNLVMNALIHGFSDDKAGQITLTISQHHSHIRTECADNGKGIAVTPINKIFEPFFTTNRHRGSSGLGLHLVYNIVTQNLKGTVSCESVPQQGTRFIIEMPTSLLADEELPAPLQSDG